MKVIRKLNKTLNFRQGIFNDKNTEIFAKVISLLMDKSDEQTEVINDLTNQIEILKTIHETKT